MTVKETERELEKIYDSVSRESFLGMYYGTHKHGVCTICAEHEVW